MGRAMNLTFAAERHSSFGLLLLSDQWDETSRRSRRQTSATVRNRLVSDREFAEIVTQHFGLHARNTPLMKRVSLSLSLSLFFYLQHTLTSTAVNALPL
jgi:hypothetical protein